MSIVSDKDFPQKSSRLEELIAQYRRDTKTDSAPVQTKNPLANVRVSSGVKVKTFDSLTPE